MPIILVVDDDPVDREQARRCLAPLPDLEIRFAEGGDEALAVLETSRPDLVLTDLRMPGMDGLDLVKRIRDDHPGLPTVLMTSRGSERIAVEALQAGAASYVPKASLKSDLLETIGDILQMLESRRTRGRLLKYFDGSQTSFHLANDPALISPVVGYLETNLERLDFSTPSARTQVSMALMEALANAMIHGNLEVSSELRQNDIDAYYALIRKRQGESPYADRRVVCTARETATEVEYVIGDEGPGFDPSSLPDPTRPEHAARVQGRGLFLIRSFMHSVEFNDRGNEITMRQRREAGS